MQFTNKPCPTVVNNINPDPNCSLKIEWLDSKEAANYLKISVGSLRNMTSNGEVPYCKLGNRNRYNLEDLRGLLFRTRKGGLSGN